MEPACKQMQNIGKHLEQFWKAIVKWFLPTHVAAGA